MKKKFVDRIIIFFLLLFFTGGILAIGKAKPFSIESVYQTNFPKIRIVSSFDASIEKDFEDLEQSNFQITVDKQPVGISAFLPPRVRKEGSATVFLVDRSRSFLAKLDKQKTVLKNYVQKMDWNDQIAIIGFDDIVEHYLLNSNKQPAFSNDKTKIIKAIDAIQSKDQVNLVTARFEAIEKGIQLLKESNRKKRNIVLITDDNRDETARLASGKLDNQYLAQLSQMMKQQKMQFFSLVMNDSSPSLRDEQINNSLITLSKDSGGTTVKNLPNAIALDKALKDTSVLTFPDMDVEGYATFFVVHQDEKTTTEEWLKDIQKGISQQLHYLHVKDSFALVREGEDIQVRNNPYEIKQDIDNSLSILHKTNGIDGLRKGMETIQSVPILRRYLILILPENKTPFEAPDDKEDIIASCKNNGISVCIISKGKFRQPFLSELSRETYGKRFIIQKDRTYQEGLNHFYNWLYHTYTLEYNSLAENQNEQDPISRVVVIATKGDEVFQDSALYFAGVKGFDLPKTNTALWVALWTIFILILLLVLFLSFGRKNLSRHSNSMLECIHCHKKIDEDSLTCPYCGKPQFDNRGQLSDNDENLDSTEFLSGENKTRIIKKPKTSFAWISVISGPDQGISFSLDSENNNTIGRDNTNTIMLDDPTISKLHAIIFQKNSRYYIQDSASQNSVFVNDVPVDRIILNDNDLICIGEIRLVFKQVNKKNLK